MSPPPTSTRPAWRLRTPDPEVRARLAREARLPELVATLLVSRGHREPAAVESHLRASPMGLHDPFLLSGMEAATERLSRAIEGGETILVHGDYDVDGVTGTTLLMRLFRVLGADARWHIPNRLVDGYSFGPHSVERARETGATVVISVDNGTSAHDVIAELKRNGVDTVVTDHHEAKAGPLPDATAIVNPKLPGEPYPWRELCGGAVAFKLAWGLARRRSGGPKVSPELKRFLEDALAYVAIATVCDVVPLLDENRVFARAGLRALEVTENPGLRALMRVAGLAGRPVSAEDVGFQIGPRINASGRLGSAQRAVDLLLAEDDDEAQRLAKELDGLNNERKEIEQAVLAEARAQARDYPDPETHPMLVLGAQGWHQGVVGIVAARLVEEFHRPALVIGLDGEEGRGSARSVDGFPLLEVLDAGAAHMLRHGGHAQAAGCEVRADALDALRDALCAEARTRLEDARDTAGDWRTGAALEVDAEIPFGDMNPELMKWLDRLEPFGPGNEAPLLVSRDLRLARPPRAVGRDGAHLMLHLRRGDHVLKAMAFRLGAREDELAMGAPVDVAYTPRWNTFRGETNLELVLHDFRTSATPPPQDSP